MKTGKLLNLLLASGALSGAAHADLLDPAPVKMGGVDLVPRLMLEHSYDDNFYRHATHPEQYWVQTVALSLDALAPVGPHEYSAHYRVDAGFVDESSVDNYVDQAVHLHGQWDADIRHRFELKGGYAQKHEARGTENFQGSLAQIVDEPPRYEITSVLAGYSYGADGASGRLDLVLAGSDKTYLNLREFTERDDRSNLDGTATFYFRVAGALFGLVEVNHGTYNYDLDRPSRPGSVDSSDNDYTNYLAGVTWELAGKTTGTLKAGRSEKNFQDADREDFNGNRWYGDIQWKPLTYSTFKFLTEQYTKEPYAGQGDYIAVTEWGVDWRHEWSDRIASRVHYLQGEEDSKGDLQGREDEPVYYGASVDYGIRRWLVFQVFYIQDDQRSNISEFDYSHGTGGIALRASL